MSNLVIGFRMDKETTVLLRSVCKARGEDLSNFVRRAVKIELARLSYLSDEEKKALGLPLHTGGP